MPIIIDNTVNLTDFILNNWPELQKEDCFISDWAYYTFLGFKRPPQPKDTRNWLARLFNPRPKRPTIDRIFRINKRNKIYIRRYDTHHLDQLKPILSRWEKVTNKVCSITIEHAPDIWEYA